MWLRNGGVGWGLAEILSTFVHVSEETGASGGGRPDAARRLEPAAWRRGPTARFRSDVR